MDSLLQVFVDNQTLFDAVKEKVRAQFTVAYEINSSMSDELVGQITRANITGLQKVEEAFRLMAQHRTAPKKINNYNPAR